MGIIMIFQILCATSEMQTETRQVTAGQAGKSHGGPDLEELEGFAVPIE